MAPTDWSDFKEQVRSQTDLVALIGETLSLSPQRGGRAYVGLCPFHEDHNPSFNVYPDRQTYRCWVCNEGGDCFSYIEKIENISFRESIELLARRAGLELPKKQRGEAVQQDGKARLYDVAAWAERLFHQSLLNDAAAEPARAYLRERGFTEAMISTFRVGYHPDDWEWLQQKARGVFTAAQLEAARLIGRRDQGSGHYDYFVDRVLFPIHDDRGRPVAFGGRVLPGRAKPDTAKYWNSPESPIFQKSRLVYGFDVAREAIRKSGTAIVMEGYTDCIIAHQYGVNNAVGTLGTALTETHVLALKRFARRVILVYDGDKAGQSATERALAKFLSQDVDLRILTLPGELDPAEYLEERGVEALRALLEEAVEAWEYKFQSALRRHGAGSLDARHRVLEEMLEFLGEAPRLGGTAREDILIGKLAQRLVVPELMIRERLKDLRRNHGRRASAAVRSDERHRVDTPGPQGLRSGGGIEETNTQPGLKRDLPGRRLTPDEVIECELLEILFAAPEVVETVRLRIGLDDFRNPQLGELLALCFDLAERGEACSVENVMNEVERPDQKRLAVWIEEQVHNKETARRLAETGGREQPTESAFLGQVLDHLTWRRELDSHEQFKGRMVELSATAELDQQGLELLRQATDFHKKRVTKKTLT